MENHRQGSTSKTSVRHRAVVTGVAVAVSLALLEGLAALWVHWRHPDLGEMLEQAAAGNTEAPISHETAARHSGERVLHPYLGYVMDYRGDGSRDKFGQAISPLGFTGSRRSPLTPPPEGTVVVALTGGSVTRRYGVAGYPGLREALADLPSVDGRPIEFMNLGLGGYKQPQQLLTVGYLLSLGVKIDVVLNIDGFNEVALHPAENRHQGVFPAFPRRWYPLAARPDFELDRLRWELSAAVGERAQVAASYRDGLLGTLAVGKLVWLAFDGPLRRRVEELSEPARTHVPASAAYVQTGPAWDQRDSDATMEFLVDIWAQSSIQLHRLCESNGIEYYHFLQPNQYVEGSKPMLEPEKKRGFRDGHPYQRGVTAGYPLMRSRTATLKAAGVRFADLTMVFANNETPLYIDSCCHFDATGYEVLSRAIGEHLRTVAGERE